ncbi:MAG: GNAT family N-acetyltransferase [Burkholderiales bacterium]|nr:GNAT family N-acetyltransferase [Burkholderiales bacterium]
MRAFGNDLTLLYESRRQSAAENDPSRYLFEESGRLLLTDKQDRDTEIGTFGALIIDVRGAVTEHESVHAVFDSDSRTIGYFEALYDSEGGDFKETVARAACGDDYLWNPNLLVLDRLVIYPDFRGHGVGLTALRALIHRLRAGCGLIAMKPFPLQFEDAHGARPESDEQQRLGLAAFKSTEARATSKLKKYYSRLGFIPIPRTAYMVRSSELPLAFSGATEN